MDPVCGLGAGLRHGHGSGFMVQSVVGPGGLLRLGLLRSSGLGMGRLRWRSRGERLRPLGKYGVRGYTRCLG